MQSSSQIITTNKPTPSLFYRPDVLPVAQPTVSKHSSEDSLYLSCGIQFRSIPTVSKLYLLSNANKPEFASISHHNYTTYPSYPVVVQTNKHTNTTDNITSLAQVISVSLQYKDNIPNNLVRMQETLKRHATCSKSNRQHSSCLPVESSTMSNLHLPMRNELQLCMHHVTMSTAMVIISNIH